jgi:hypothetical protein
MRENWQLYSWQGINNQNLQGDQKSKLHKNQWPNEEMGKWTEHNFFHKGKIQMVKAYEEMLNITGN